MDELSFIIWMLPTGWAAYSLLMDKRDPPLTLLWLVFVTVLPVVGPVFYFFFGPQRLVRAAIKRKSDIEEMLRLHALSPILQQEHNAELSGEDRPVLQLVEQISEYGVTGHNRVDILSDPQIALSEMEAAIAEARSFIHMEFYIIASDEVTSQLFDALEAALDRGVEVRILYDSLGSLSLKRLRFRKLKAKGAKIAGFLPIRKIIYRFNVNFRNHRKMLIIDGKLAFTGSANIGRQYLGKKSQWRDNMVRVEGPVCRQLQDVFAKDWHFTTKEELFLNRYYTKEIEEKGESIVQVLESGPDTPFHNLHQALFLAINSAKSRILLTTPYFIPDTAIRTALMVAARRGVSVKLLLPKKSDSSFVKYASRSFYEPLLLSGAQLYEYRPKIMHAKMMVIDDKWTILGSFNMDIRSFTLNFELNLLIRGKDVAEQARSIFDGDLAESEKVDLQQYLNRPIYQQLLENTCRLFSPIL